jgi:hypothetical protein
LLDCFTEHFPDFLSDLPVIVSSRAVGGEGYKLTACLFGWWLMAGAGLF